MKCIDIEIKGEELVNIVSSSLFSKELEDAAAEHMRKERKEVLFTLSKGIDGEIMYNKYYGPEAGAGSYKAVPQAFNYFFGRHSMYIVLTVAFKRISVFYPNDLEKNIKDLILGRNQIDAKTIKVIDSRPIAAVALQRNNATIEMLLLQETGEISIGENPSTLTSLVRNDREYWVDNEVIAALYNKQRFFQAALLRFEKNKGDIYRLTKGVSEISRFASVYRYESEFS